MSTLNINGKDRQVDVDPSTPILWAALAALTGKPLRDLPFKMA